MKLKPIHGVLLLAILGIWGAVALQIADAVRADEAPVAARGGIRRAGVIDARGISYSEAVRDPFRWGPAKKDTVRRKPAKQLEPIPAWQPPEMKLVGIVLGENGRTALVELSDGSTVFLSKQDTLLGVRIAEIEAKRVVYAYQGKRAEWSVE